MVMMMMMIIMMIMIKWIIRQVVAQDGVHWDEME